MERTAAAEIMGAVMGYGESHERIVLLYPGYVVLGELDTETRDTLNEGVGSKGVSMPHLIPMRKVTIVKHGGEIFHANKAMLSPEQLIGVSTEQ